MKKLLLSVVLATTLTLTSCQFDDSDIWDKFGEMEESIRDHEQRISALEELCKQMNTNIEALQTLVDALEKRDYVTNVSEVYSNGEVIGYTISFGNSDSITIYHGKDGADGKDGYTPQIGVMKDTDDIYYWTLDGEWLLDGKGNKIQANGVNGTDGTNGSNGTNGTNGVTPQLKIENDYWYVSYDNGATWVQLGKATGEDGKDGQDSFIIGVEESETEVVFILSNNTTITLPKHAKSSLADPNDICTAMDDVKFMEYCYKNFDVNKDSKVSPVEAKSVRSIDISDLTVYSIKGVEYFEILETFIAKNTLLRNVDLSFNSKLISFSLDGCTSLTSVTIPDSVTKIGNYAFCACTSLTSVTIGNSVTSIGDYAFSGCSSLTSVTIPNSATSIGDYAFSGCRSLTSVTIPDSVNSIGSRAFNECTSLTSVTIPDSVTSIGNYAFNNCTSLATITIPDSVTEIGNSAFSGCTGELIINSKIIETDYMQNDYPSRNYNGWLYGTKFTKLTIGDSVTKIGNATFYNCTSLTSITIPNSVTSIGDSTFYGCTSLKSVTIPDSVTSIGYGAFAYCSSLTSVTIGNGVTSIGDGAFYGCTSLTSVTIGNSVTSIGESAFSGCLFEGEDFINNSSLDAVANNYWGAKIYDVVQTDGLCINGTIAVYCQGTATSITIPDSVTSIGDYAFSGCKSLTSVTIPDSVNSIGSRAFNECTSLTSVTIPDSVTSIGNYAFNNCTSLTSVTIGNSVTAIGNYAFYYCRSLTSITIPDSVTSIGERAFYNCTSLTSVYCKPTTPPTGGSSMFSNNASGRKIYVPVGSGAVYKVASGWSTYALDIIDYNFETGEIVEPEAPVTPEPEQPVDDLQITSTQIATVVAAGSYKLTNGTEQAVADEATWFTLDANGLSLTGCRVLINNNKDPYKGHMQFQGDGSDVAKQGFLGNTLAYNDKAIKKIVVEAISSYATPSFNVYYGAEKLPNTTAIATTADNCVKGASAGMDGSYEAFAFTCTFDIPAGNKFFALRNDSKGPTYIKNITIVFEE